MHGGHSGRLHSGLHTWFRMFLRQVGEQVGGCCAGGGGGTQGGHSGTSHCGLHKLFLMFRRQVEEHVGGGTVTYDVILSSSSTSDHSSGWVLDLHLVKQDATIFCELDLASSTDEPIFQKKRRVR